MKKIINGRLYNTETAPEVAYYWNGLGGSDFRNLTKRLHRKKNGEFFFWVSGGPMSEAGESYGGMIHSGEKIVPCSDDEAREFCEANLDADDYMKIFGEVEE